jgi:hypothetical protein
MLLLPAGRPGSVEFSESGSRIEFMNEWRLDDSLNEMHDLFLTTCVKELYDTLTWCIKTRF